MGQSHAATWNCPICGWDVQPGEQHSHEMAVTNSRCPHCGALVYSGDGHRCGLTYEELSGGMIQQALKTAVAERDGYYRAVVDGRQWAVAWKKAAWHERRKAERVRHRGERLIEQMLTQIAKLDMDRDSTHDRFDDACRQVAILIAERDALRTRLAAALAELGRI